MQCPIFVHKLSKKRSIGLFPEIPKDATKERAFEIAFQLPNLHQYSNEIFYCACQEKKTTQHFCLGQVLFQAFEARYFDVEPMKTKPIQKKFRSIETNPQGLKSINWPRTDDLDTEAIYIDEVGRGCLAGPMLLCGVRFLKSQFAVPGIHDSKLLEAHERSLLYETLITHPDLRFFICKLEVEELDKLGMGLAWKTGVRRCVQALLEEQKVKDDPPLTKVVLDGDTAVSELPLPLECVPKADQKFLGVSIASIIAKVERDRFMVRLGKSLEVGNPFKTFFIDCKGYANGGKQNSQIPLIRAGRYTPYHRKSFEPLKGYLATQGRTVVAAKSSSSK